jgi:hypothetical protein
VGGNNIYSNISGALLRYFEGLNTSHLRPIILYLRRVEGDSGTSPERVLEINVENLFSQKGRSVGVVHDDDDE